MIAPIGGASGLGFGICMNPVGAAIPVGKFSRLHFGLMFRPFRTSVESSVVAPVGCDGAAGHYVMHLSNILRRRGTICEPVERAHGRFLAALATTLATASLAYAQQATLVGTLDGHTDPVYGSPGAPTARRSSRRVSITRSGSGTRLSKGAQESSRAMPTRPRGLPCRPTANKDPRRAASTLGPDLGPSCDAPARTLDDKSGPVHALAVNPTASRRRSRRGKR